MKRYSKDRSFIILEILCMVGFTASIITSSMVVDGWLQAFFISLGTGLISSAIVSFAFWKIQHDSEKRNAVKKSKDFMEQAKILFYNILGDINWASIKNTTITLCEYIEAQHRRFHECYKRMVVDNSDEIEKGNCIAQILEFNTVYASKLKSLFESRIIWEEGDFTERQLNELKSMYSEFCECLDYMSQKNYERAFLSFAWFLEILMRILCQDNFFELDYFNLLKFKYEDDGKLLCIDDDFDEKELMIKFAKEFNGIRYNNYKEHYGKNDQQELTND